MSYTEKIVRKINKFTFHPVGMGFSILLCLEFAEIFFNPNPIATFIVWLLSNGIMGWRIMRQTDIIRMTPSELVRSNFKIKLYFAILFVIGIISTLASLYNIIIYVVTGLGACLVYFMRNESYKRKYGDRLL